MRKGPTVRAKNSRFTWQPLGGLGEVGMNTMLLHFGDTCIPVDAGISFADPNDFGIEAIHVDYRPILEKYRPTHWLITHGHEDHIGAVGAILQASHDTGVECPVILAPPLATALILSRMSDDSRYPDARKLLHKIESIACGSEVRVGDVRVVFLETRHSTIDTCSLAFEWHGGEKPLRVIHTADFKIDEHAFSDGVKKLKDVYGIFADADASVDFLFVDSTNSERPGHSVSESEILPGLERLIAAAEGRIFLTLFSSNVQRVASLINLAAKHGRYTCLAGRSLQTSHRIAQDLGLYGDRCEEIGNVNLRDIAEMARLPAAKQLIICSGSQGEQRSVLAKLGQGTHQDFDLGPEDTVIFSSKLIPGNERPVGRLINGLIRRGAKILMGEAAKEEAGGPIHASGHARSGEIAAVMNYLRPKHVIPVHGELRHLMSCAAIAHREGLSWKLPIDHVHVVENGAELVFGAESEGWELKERNLAVDLVPRYLRMETFETPSRDPFLRIRKRAALNGILSVALDSMGRVSMSLEGTFPESTYVGEWRDMIEDSVRSWLSARYHQMTSKAFRQDDPGLRREIGDDLSRHIRRITGLKPYVIVHLMGG